jgi:hypothetical protein
MITGTVSRTWNDEPLPDDRHVRFAVRPTEASLQVRFSGVSFGHNPLPGPGGSTPRLWESNDVVELFVGGEEGYLEIEFGPLGHYLALRFSGYRALTEEGLALTYRSKLRSQTGPRHWAGLAEVPWEHLPSGPLRLNVCVIQPGPLYAQWSPAGGEKPDFHDSSCWKEVGWSRRS